MSVGRDGWMGWDISRPLVPQEQDHRIIIVITIPIIVVITSSTQDEEEQMVTRDSQLCLPFLTAAPSSHPR